MRHVLGVLLLAVGLGTATAQTPNWEYLKQGVVKIQSGSASEGQVGTGFVYAVTPGTLRIVTAKHVLNGSDGKPVSQVSVFFSSDPVTAVPATALGPRSDLLDLAVLEVHPTPRTKLPHSFPRFQWLADDTLQQGEPVWTMDGDWNVVPNTVTRLDAEANPQKFLYTATSLGDGFSGAPVFNSGGFLIGMHDAATGGAAGSPSFSVAVKIGSAFAALDALGYRVEDTLGAAAPDPHHGAAAVGSPPGGGTAAPAPTAKPRAWRDLANNRLYTFQQAGDRLYIRDGNTVVADLVLTPKDKRGLQKFAGQGRLSSCPNGTGAVEIDSIESSRIEGRVEQPATVNGKQQCGGFFGKLRSLAPVVWLPE